MESQDDFFPIIDMVVFMIVCMVKCNGILGIIFLEIIIHKMPLFFVIIRFNLIVYSVILLVVLTTFTVCFW